MGMGVKCLYVDDDPGVRDLVTVNLRAEGVDVHVAENGLGVEQLVQEIRPDIVLLDVMMPGRDGYDVLTSLKSSDVTRDIPVVLLTARASDAEIWQGWKAGADYYLTKPFNVDHLVEYLRIVMDDRRRN
jgi:two-component system phosphate regulon response regulator PhoB